MFTILDIERAHEKVQSGADFPNYVKEIYAMGVLGFEYQVKDGTEVYYGKDQQANSQAKYAALNVAKEVNLDLFKAELLRHQQGETNFETFVQMCADTGIAYWKVDINKGSCTYFDLSDTEQLSEAVKI